LLNKLTEGSKNVANFTKNQFRMFLVLNLQLNSSIFGDLSKIYKNIVSILVQTAKILSNNANIDILILIKASKK